MKQAYHRDQKEDSCNPAAQLQIDLFAHILLRFRNRLSKNHS